MARGTDKETIVDFVKFIQLEPFYKWVSMLPVALFWIIYLWVHNLVLIRTAKLTLITNQSSLKSFYSNIKNQGFGQ